MKNAFEHHGKFETLHEISTNKTLGTRRVSAPDREPGIEGQIEVVLTSDVILERGPKSVTIKASPDKPRRCYSTIYFICGRPL